MQLKIKYKDGSTHTITLPDYVGSIPEMITAIKEKDCNVVEVVKLATWRDQDGRSA